MVALSAEYASGTPGGTNATGAWTTRPINVKSVDTAGICTLSSNEFTLPPGRYKIDASALFCQTDYAQLRLYNVTGAAVVLLGQNSRTVTAASHGAPALLVGVFDLAAAATLRIEYRTTTQYISGGLGLSMGWGTEIYAQIMLEKVR